MARGSYIGGSSVIRVGSAGTSWVRFVEPVSKIRNVEKKYQPSLRGLAKSYIFVRLYAEAAAASSPNPPKLIRAEIDLAGGFAAWCQADAERRAWLEEAQNRARKRAQRRVD